MSQELQNTQDRLYNLYLDKLDKGEYIIPPCLIIGEIVRNRYLPENLDIIDDGWDTSIVVNSVEDLRNRELFLDIIADSDIEDGDIMIQLNDKLCIYKYMMNFIKTRTVVIKYPTTTITNSEGRTHEIKDLFIRIVFNASGTITGNFTMGRSTYTVAELMCGYKHSHHRSIEVSEDHLRAFNSTCLGSGVLATTMGYMRGVALEEFDEVRVMAMFADIDAYVGWESLEGVPHIRMSSISSMDRNGNQLRPISQYWSPSGDTTTLVKELLNNSRLMSFFKLIPSIKDNHPYYEIDSNEYELITFITEVAQQKGLYNRISNYNGTCLLSRDEFGNVTYYRLGGVSDRLDTIKRSNNLTLFTFKGEPVKLQITDLNNQEEDTNIERVVQPEVMLYIIKEIEKEINKKNGRNKFQQSDF